jgi:hypothetical protein
LERVKASWMSPQKVDTLYVSLWAVNLILTHDLIRRKEIKSLQTRQSELVQELSVKRKEIDAKLKSIIELVLLSISSFPGWFAEWQDSRDQGTEPGLEWE